MWQAGGGERPDSRRVRRRTQGGMQASERPGRRNGPAENSGLVPTSGQLQWKLRQTDEMSGQKSGLGSGQSNAVERAEVV